MKLSNSLRIVFSLFLLALYGCGGAGLTNTSPPAPTLTGNWLITAEVVDLGKLGPGGQPTYTPITSVAYLSQDAMSVSGTVEDAFCKSSGGTYPVSGSLDNGQLALMPAVALPQISPSFSLNATVSANLASLQGQVVVSPSGCEFPSILTATGQQVESFAGTWTGTLASVDGPSATITATLIETGPDSSGFPAVSGIVTISGSPCFTSGTLAGNQFGNLLSATITTNNGVIEIPQIDDGDAFLDSNNQLAVTFSVQGGTCNGDNAQGTLALQ